MIRSLALSRPLPALLAAVPFALLGSLAPAPAAPVPNHLMPKGPRPLSHPTARGTTWVYDRMGREETDLITAVTERNGVTVITIESADPTGNRTPDRKVMVTARDWSWTEESGHAYEPPWVVLKAPTGEEQTWALDSPRSDKVKIAGRSVQGAKPERVRTPAGTFDAVRVEATYRTCEGGAEVKSTYWFAPGIGLVQVNDPPTLVLKRFIPGKE